MTRARREIVKRLRFNEDQSTRLDSYLVMKKLTFTDFTHYLIESELNRLGWQCNDNVQFEELEANTIAVDLPIRKRRRAKINIIGRPAPDMDPELLRALGRIGNNVNQIARSLNFLCLQHTEEIQQFSFIDCIDILEHIQTELHQYLPTLPIYMVTEEQSKRRKARAIALAEKEGR